MTARTAARRPSPTTAALVGLAVVGLALLIGFGLVVFTWLAITAALLVVPFAVWWVIDRSRAEAAAAPPADPVIPRPRTTSRPPPAPALPAGLTTPVTLATAASSPHTSHRAVSRHSAHAAPPSPPAPPRPFLAPDRRVTVTREEDHQPTLARRHRDRPVTRVTAELHPSVVTHGAHLGDWAVEVRLDGERVGELTAATSARYRHLVEPTATGPAACLGTISYGERGYRIELRLPKA